MQDFKNQLKAIMTGLSETYDKPVTPSLFKIYMEALKAFDINNIQIAVSKHMLDKKHGSFFPKPADIARYIPETSIAADDKANIAWMDIESQIRKKGAYGSLELDDKQALMAVKHMGSWQSLCHTDIDKLQWKRKEFIDNYKSLENTDCSYLQKLEGIEDLQNQRLSSDSRAKQIGEIKI